MLAAMATLHSNDIHSLPNEHCSETPAGHMATVSHTGTIMYGYEADDCNHSNDYSLLIMIVLSMPQMTTIESHGITHGMTYSI